MIKEVEEFSKTQQCKTLIDEYEIEKSTIRDLAKKYNFSRKFIKNVLQYNHITIRGSFLTEKNKSLFESIGANIIEDYKKQGENVRSLARKYSLSRAKINNILGRANVRLKSCEAARQEQIALGIGVGKNHHNFGKSSPIGSGRCRWYRYHNKTYQGSWEFMFGLWLEQQDIKFNVHENVKQFHCKHENEMEFTYCPDFYLVDYDRYVEVKGYFSDENKKRMQLFRQQHSNIDVTIIDKNKLVEIGAFEVQKKLNIDLELYQLDYENEKSVKKFIDNTNKIEFLKFHILDGLNLSELAQKYDVPYRVISHAYNLWVPEHGSNEFYQFILQQCKDSIIKDCELGLSFRNIVRKYKFRSNTKILLEAIRNWGITLQSDKLSKQIEDRNITIEQNIVSDYLSGLSISQICHKYGQEYGVHKKKVKRILRENNVKVRSIAHYTKQRHEEHRQSMLDSVNRIEIIDNYKQGMSIKQICRQYGILKIVVKKLLTDNNVDLRPSTYYSSENAKKPRSVKLKND